MKGESALQRKNSKANCSWWNKRNSRLWVVTNPTEHHDTTQIFPAMTLPPWTVTDASVSALWLKVRGEDPNLVRHAKCFTVTLLKVDTELLCHSTGDWKLLE